MENDINFGNLSHNVSVQKTKGQVDIKANSDARKEMLINNILVPSQKRVGIFRDMLIGLNSI